MNDIKKKVKNYIMDTEPIGAGAYGKVYVAANEEKKGKKYAIKVIPILKNQDFSNERLRSEFEIPLKFFNSYIVRVHEAFRSTHNYYVVMDYCEDGDLSQFIKSKYAIGETIAEKEALRIISDVLEAFKALISYFGNFFHRDIKPANILLHNGRAKLCDFGVSKLYFPEGETNHTMGIGSPSYIAPEMLLIEKYDSKIDVWSLGVCLFELLYGTVPWKGAIMVYLNEISEKGLVFPEKPERSPEIKKLIGSMLVKDPENRVSFNDLFNHPLFKNSENEDATVKLEINKVKVKKDELKPPATRPAIVSMQSKIVEKDITPGDLLETRINEEVDIALLTKFISDLFYESFIKESKHHVSDIFERVVLWDVAISLVQLSKVFFSQLADLGNFLKNQMIKMNKFLVELDVEAYLTTSTAKSTINTFSNLYLEQRKLFFSLKKEVIADKGLESETVTLLEAYFDIIFTRDVITQAIEVFSYKCREFVKSFQTNLKADPQLLLKMKKNHLLCCYYMILACRAEFEFANIETVFAEIREEGKKSINGVRYEFQNITCEELIDIIKKIAAFN